MTTLIKQANQLAADRRRQAAVEYRELLVKERPTKGDAEKLAELLATLNKSIADVEHDAALIGQAATDEATASTLDAATEARNTANRRVSEVTAECEQRALALQRENEAAIATARHTLSEADATHKATRAARDRLNHYRATVAAWERGVTAEVVLGERNERIVAENRAAAAELQQRQRIERDQQEAADVEDESKHVRRLTHVS
jgi:hypothetical protein